MSCEAATTLLQPAEKIMREKTFASSDNEFWANLNRAADYVQDHYAESLSLKKLAAIAHYSKYHFHRLFREHFGETANNRIRRVRMEHAAHQLIMDADASVAAVAVASGFSSPQNFARAFKAHFGFPPTAVRKRSDLQIGKSMKIRPDERDNKPSLTVEVKILSPQHVAFIRDIGLYCSDSNMQTVYRLKQWAMSREINDRYSLPIVVAWSDPATTPDPECVCDLCLMVPEHITGDGEVSIQCLPGGHFAVLHGEIQWEAITALRNRFFYEWLPRSGFQRDERPYYFIYYNSPNMNPRKLVILDICLPVKFA